MSINARSYHEHTSQHELISLDSRERNSLLTTLLTGSVKLPGASLYLPVALNLTRLKNQGSCMMDLPRSIPNSSSVAWPLSVFTPKPTKSLSILDKEQDDEIDREGFNLIS